MWISVEYLDSNRNSELAHDRWLGDERWMGRYDSGFGVRENLIWW